MIKVDAPETAAGHKKVTARKKGCVAKRGCPVRLARMLHEVLVLAISTDRSSSGHWLERLSCPDLGPGCLLLSPDPSIPNRGPP